MQKLNFRRRLAYGVTIAAMCGFISACGEDESTGGLINPNNGVAIGNFASRSGTIQLDTSERFLAVLNSSTVEANGSLSIFQVRDGNGNDSFVKIGQVNVGNKPESVSIMPDGSRAFVSNGADNSVSVIDIPRMQVTATIPVGSEPRGTALTPRGSRLYVANHSDGTVSVIDVNTNTVVQTIALTGGGPIVNPFGVLVSNDRDDDELDETVFVTDFWGRQIPGRTADNTEAFDNGKEGRIFRITTFNNTVLGISRLSPMASGFTQDRSAFTGAGVGGFPPFKLTYAVGAPVNANPSNGYFNQMHSMTDDPNNGSRLYVTSIAAQPEPPINFANNVQAFIGGIDTQTGAEDNNIKTNLNNLIRVETAPAAEPLDANTSLTRTFMADTVDMSVRNGTAVFITRAGSYLLKGTVGANGAISLNNSAATPAVRIPTGNIPNGVVMNSTATRAYVNNTVDRTFTAINLQTNSRIGNNIASADLPAPGTLAHNAIIGELVFFTGFGVPVNNLLGQNVRNINTHPHKNRASDNNWSSCASCHHQGLMDQVTWSFGSGPRNTVSMDGSFSKATPGRQRVFNLSAVMGSVTDFNGNSRGVQGGVGWTPGGGADFAQVFPHGPTAGVSQALDLMTLWMQLGIRTFNAPSNLNQASVTAGRTAFGALNCNQCHGGDLWTLSAVRWNRPLFTNGGFGTKLDARVQNIPNTAVLQNFDAQPGTGVFNLTASATGTIPIITMFQTAPGALIIPLLTTQNTAIPGTVTASTLDLAGNPIEIRGAGAAGAANGLAQAPIGAAGSFNPPSLLGLAHSAPYGHHGRAQTLPQVFDTIANGGLGHPTFGATAQQLADLAVFLQSIDSRTTPFTNPFATP